MGSATAAGHHHDEDIAILRRHAAIHEDQAGRDLAHGNHQAAAYCKRLALALRRGAAALEIWED